MNIHENTKQNITFLKHVFYFNIFKSVFTDTFNQFNVSLLNKSNNFFKRQILTTNI